jgi:exopolysaccharide biosynthesis polyprenyl glycosylphosphotransferase
MAPGPSVGLSPERDADSMILADLAPALDEQTLEILHRRGHAAGMRRRGWLVRRALLCADLLGLTLAFTISEELYKGIPSSANSLGTVSEYAVFFLVLPLWVVAAKLYGLYDRDDSRATHNTADDVVRVFHLVTIVAWLLVAGAYLTGVASPAFTKVITFWMLAIPFVVVLRFVARAICRRRFSYLQNTLIVGAGDVGQQLAAKILRHPEYGINLVGFVDEQPKEARPGLANLTLLGSSDEVASIARALDIERVIIAFSNDSAERTLDIVRSLHDVDAQVDVVPRLFDLFGPSSEIHTLEGTPLLGMPSPRLSGSSRILKRSMDVVLSGVGLVLLTPLFLAIACAIKLDSRGTVFFRQLRTGRDGELFRIFKFRTMGDDAEERKAEIQHLNKHLQPGSDARMFKIPNDPRITRVGRFLRRYSLDELPQLINVFKGEMSLVGPRPLILDEDQHVDDWARKRMELKPGITGLWQVLGRSEIPFEDMVKLDYLYVTTWSLWQDFLLLFRTIPVVVGSSRGAY